MNSSCNHYLMTEEEIIIEFSYMKKVEERLINNFYWGSLTEKLW